jgi:arylsulfatase A-like enzyme
VPQARPVRVPSTPPSTSTPHQIQLEPPAIPADRLTIGSLARRHGYRTACIGKAELEARGHFPSGPLRGAKADAWEGGHRVPFIVRWPGMVKPGTVSGQLVHQADLTRTFAAAMDAELPENASEDSFSLLPILKGDDKPVRTHAVSTSIEGVQAVRHGHWKYIAAPGSGGWGKGGDQSQPVQLYNLAEDLGETNNLAAAMPKKVAEMKTLLETLINDGASRRAERR